AGEAGATVADAVSQLMGPLISSTLTTVVVFAPLGLLSGVTGQFFRALSMTLTVAVLLSLFLSVTVVPMLSQWAFRRHQQEHKDGEAKPEAGLTRFYGRSLDAVVRRPFLAI